MSTVNAGTHTSKFHTDDEYDSSEPLVIVDRNKALLLRVENLITCTYIFQITYMAQLLQI